MLNSIIEYFKEAYQINPIGQIIGFIAFFLGLIGYLHKNDDKTKSIQGASLFLRVAHYYIIGLYTGLASDLIGGFRNFLSIRYKKNNKIITIIIIVYLFAGYMTYDNIYSTLPIISGLIASFTYFYLEGIKMRLMLLLCSCLWVTYNYFGYSIGGMITDIFYMGAHIITISRLIIDKKKLK